MRLDKFVGKASYNQEISVYDYDTRKEIFSIRTGEDYPDLKKEMKHYKVTYYVVGSSKLYVDAKKKED